MSRILLEVKYFPQWDSETKQAGRMCFSSSCAMMLDYLRPDVIKMVSQEDDKYLKQLNTLGGDSTDPNAQLETLKYYGQKAKYIQNGSFETIDKQLAKGMPVPIGILHHGHVSSPTGGGHWVCVVGHNEDKSVYFVNDPAGELDLSNGGYHLDNNGKMRKYSKTNLGKRWMVEGNGTGWAIIAEK